MVPLTWHTQNRRSYKEQNVDSGCLQGCREAGMKSRSVRDPSADENALKQV